MKQVRPSTPQVCRTKKLDQELGREFWIAAVVMAGFAIYVVARVRMYMRQSDAEWRKVDQSKLKSWDEDDERK